MNCVLQHFVCVLSIAGNNFRKFDTGPPEKVIPLGYFDYACQDDLVCKVTIQDVPYFNAPIYLENKEQVGKIDEIFGNLRDYYVTVKPGDNMKASSFQQQQKVWTVVFCCICRSVLFHRRRWFNLN